MFYGLCSTLCLLTAAGLWAGRLKRQSICVSRGAWKPPSTHASPAPVATGHRADERRRSEAIRCIGYDMAVCGVHLGSCCRSSAVTCMTHIFCQVPLACGRPVGEVNQILLLGALRPLSLHGSGFRIAREHGMACLPVLMAYPDLASNLQGSLGEGQDNLAADDLGTGPGWRQSKQN